MDWSVVGYLWIIVMFLSAAWTLILTAPIQDPLVSKWCNAKYLQNCSGEETNWFTVHLAWPESEYIFSNFSFLGEILL